MIKKSKLQTVKRAKEALDEAITSYPPDTEKTVNVIVELIKAVYREQDDEGDNEREFLAYRLLLEKLAHEVNSFNVNKNRPLIASERNYIKEKPLTTSERNYIKKNPLTKTEKTAATIKRKRKT